MQLRTKNKIGFNMSFQGENSLSKTTATADR